MTITVTGPFVGRDFTLLRFHLPLVEPDRRVSRIRLSDQSHGFAHRGRRRTRRTRFTRPHRSLSCMSGYCSPCPAFSFCFRRNHQRSHGNEGPKTPSLSHAVSPEASEPCRAELLVPLQVRSPGSPLGRTPLEARSLLSPGITRLQRYYEPLRLPPQPGPLLTKLRLARSSRPRRRIAPVALVSSCRVPSSLPRGNPRPKIVRKFLGQRPSPFQRRVGFHDLRFRGLLDVHSRDGPPTR